MDKMLTEETLISTTTSLRLESYNVTRSTSRFNTTLNGTTDSSKEQQNSNQGQVIVVDFRQWYSNGYEYIIYGYGIPSWTAVNILVYSYMIYLLVKHSMTSKTQICLLFITIFDVLTPLFPAVMWFYFFGVLHHYYYLPYSWCRTYHYMTEVIPHIFKSTSFYLTVFLAIQRYIVVGYPLKVNRFCSGRIVKCSIGSCFLFALLKQAVYFVHYDYFGIDVPAFSNPNKTMQACAVRRPRWINISFFKYLGISQCINTILENIIPCALLLVFEILLINSMHKANTKRKRMTEAASSVHKEVDKKERQITYSTVGITSLTLLYNSFATFQEVLDDIYLMFQIQIIDNNDLRSMSVVMNFVYYAILPSNFIIICFMSAEFRKHVKATFVPVGKLLKKARPPVTKSETMSSLRYTNSTSLSSVFLERVTSTK